MSERRRVFQFSEELLLHLTGAQVDTHSAKHNLCITVQILCQITNALLLFGYPFNAAPSSLFPPPVEPLSVHCGGFGGGDVRQEEAVGCWRAGSDRERIQATSRGQKLVPTGISELKCLFTRNTVCAQVYLRVLSSHWLQTLFTGSDGWLC